MRRAQQARSLNIGPLQSSHDINIVANAVQQANNSWEQLRELKAEHTTSVCTAEDIVLLRSTVCWLWGRARHLAFLRLLLHGLHYIPCLVQLKHLQLTLRRCSFCQVAGSLSGLVDLQTLSLDQSWGFPQKILIPSERPSLALEGLSQLQSVMLCCVVPASLTLPPGAALHLRMCNLDCVRQQVWQTVASALQSVHINSTAGEVVEHPSQLPSIFAGQSGLKSIMMELGSFGKQIGPIVLYGAFLQVERLLIRTRSNDLCMRVPAGRLPWRVVRFVSFHALDIAFDNVGDFLDCCPAFSMWYQSLGGNLMSFRQGIADRGIHWGSQFESDFSLHEIHSLCTPHEISHLYLCPENLCECYACTVCSERGRHMYRKQV